MSFHSKPFNERFNAMGDEAEAVFDALFPRNHKLGLNRPPFGMAGMPTAMRYTPDRMTRHALVECMGIGRQQNIKIKDEKLEALERWRWVGPVELFVWDSHRRRWWKEPLHEWAHVLGWYGTYGAFHDGKEYKQLTVEHFPGEPTDFDPDGLQDVPK